MVKTPVRSIVNAIAGAAARWNDAGFLPRARARDAVRARTGYSRAVVEYALDSLFEALRRDTIEAVIADELGCLEVLDGFVDLAGRSRARALPMGSVCVISSRTTVGVAIVPAVFALCAKCRVVVKDREDHLVAAFFATVAEELGHRADVVEAQIWDGKNDAARLAGFDVVVAFGGDSTLHEIAAGLRFPTRLIAYGSKTSAGYLTREALRNETNARDIARRAARDVVLYDGEGCLSLRALFVERGAAISSATFGEMLAGAVRASAVEFPLGVRDAKTTSQLAMARDLAMFRMAAGDRIHSDPDSSFLVVVDTPPDEPPLLLPRAIAIRSVECAAEASAYCERHGITLEALAVEHPRPDVIEAALNMGASRISSFGALQQPPLGGFHGGRPRIAEFVRWIVDET